MVVIKNGNEFLILLNALIEILEKNNHLVFAEKLKKERDNSVMPGDFYTNIGSILYENRNTIAEDLILVRIDALLTFISAWY